MQLVPSVNARHATVNCDCTTTQLRPLFLSRATYAKLLHYVNSLMPNIHTQKGHFITLPMASRGFHLYIYTTWARICNMSTQNANFLFTRCALYFLQHNSVNCAVRNKDASLSIFECFSRENLWLFTYLSCKRYKSNIVTATCRVKLFWSSISVFVLEFFQNFICREFRP